MLTYDINNNKEKRLDLLGRLYFFSLPLTFITLPGGLLFSDLIGIILVVKMMFKNKYRVGLPLLIAFYFFLMGSLLGMIRSPDDLRSVKSIIQQTLVILVLYPVMKNYLNDCSNLKKVLNVYKNGVLILAFFIISFYLSGNTFGITNTVFASSRIAIGGTGPNVIARVLVIGALITLYFSQVGFKYRSSVIWYLQFFVISFGILTTLSISGILLWVIGSIWLLYVYNSKKNIKNFSRLLVIGGAGLLVMIFLYMRVDFIQDEIEMVLQRVNSAVGVNFHSIMNNTRLILLRDFLDYLGDYWILGVGYSNSNYLVGTVIHFPLLAALVEIGLIGFFGILIMYFYPIYMIFKRKRIVRWDVTSVLSVLIILGDMIQPNPNYRFTWFAILLPVVIFTSKEKYKYKRKENENNIYIE